MKRRGRQSTDSSGDVASRQIMDSIRRLVQVLRVAARESEKRAGISGAQVFVLSKLAQANGPLSVNELAERTLTHQSSVSVVVKKLVDSGLISRTSAADDHRRLELSLTPAGRNIVRKAPEAAQERLIAALDSLDARRRRDLAALLDELCCAAGAGPAIPLMLFEDGKSTKANRDGRTRN